MPSSRHPTLLLVFSYLLFYREETTQTSVTLLSAYRACFPAGTALSTTHIFRLHDSNYELNTCPSSESQENLKYMDYLMISQGHGIFIFIFKVLGCVSQYSNRGLFESVNKSMLSPHLPQFCKIVDNHFCLGWWKEPVCQHPTLSVER